MENPNVPDEIDESTQICRICLNDDRELQSIFSFGQICDKNVRLVEVITDCTSIEVNIPLTFVSKSIHQKILKYLQFDENEPLPSMICQPCLLQICKIHKFRELAFRSNILLRQKLIKRRPPMKTYTVNRNKGKKNLMIDVDELNISPKKETPLDIADTNDIDDAEIEYLTVIVANEETTESDEGTIECLIEDQDEIESQQNDDSATEEIPKVSLANYRRRTKNDDPNKSLTCPECGKTLSNFSSYKYHMQLHSDDTPFLCSECGQGFKTRNAYDGHMITHMDSNPNKCDVCNKTYRQAASLRSHMLTHTGEKVCPFSIIFSS